MFVRIILLITDVTGNNDCSASNSSASHRTVVLHFVFCFAAVFWLSFFRCYIIRKGIRYTSYDQQDVYEK